MASNIAQPSNIKTLLVDDDDSTRDLFQVLLQRRGHQVVGCATAEEAWRRCAQDSFHFMLVDWMLPGKDGLSLCRDIRAAPNGRNPVLFVCTARREAQDLVDVLSAGADDYMPKPVDPDLFNIRISVAEQQVRNRQIRRQAEEALQKSEMRFRRLFESHLMGILFWNQEGRILEANDAFLKIVGYSREDLKSGLLDWRKLTPPEFSHLDQAALKEIEQTGECKPFEKQYLRKNGTRAPILIGGAYMQDSQQGVAFILDLTERESLEQQLRQSQKMEAIGQLAGGVAHDFNNLLTVILGRANLVVARLKENDPLRKDIELIAKTGERAASLTRQLLAFSRRQILTPRVVDLNATIADVNTLLRRLIGEDIDLKLILSRDLGCIKVDPSQIEQVIVNLAVNARDAMPKGGALIIETRNMDFADEHVINRVDITPGRYTMLAITDTGMGINPEDLDRIFDPFFTTKNTGTGLGLSTVYGIVKQSGGHINVYSERNKGTTFRIYMPQVDEKPDAVEAVTHSAPPDGTETIMIIEDDESVRQIAVNFLSLSGYKVISPETSEKGIEIAKKPGSGIDLFLVDLVMPGASGGELIDQLKQCCPRARILLMSGYTNKPIDNFGLHNPKLIQKPFSRLELCGAVRNMLDNPPQS